VQFLVALSSDFCAVFCRQLYVILSLYYFGYCIVLLELRFLIISSVMLVSSNGFFLVNFNDQWLYISHLNYSHNVSQPFLLKQWDLPINYKQTRSFWFVIRVTRQVSHVEQELLILPKYLSSPPVFRSEVFCVMFCRSLFVVFCLALYCLSIYGFWLSILYLQSVRGKRRCLNTH
jgi:hypothetical protein